MSQKIDVEPEGDEAFVMMYIGLKSYCIVY